MINLLPTGLKQGIAYARRNTILLRWAGILLISVIGMAGIVLGGQTYMRQAIKAYSKQLENDRSTLQLQKLDESQKRLEDISSSLNLVIQVLSKEVLFSKLLTQLGSAVPPRVALLGLTIDKVQGGLTLRAGAADIEAATQLQINLQDPANKIFEKADIEKINCIPDAGVSTPYPCTVELKVLFTKNNPFLFISDKEDGGGN